MRTHKAHFLFVSHFLRAQVRKTPRHSRLFYIHDCIATMPRCFYCFTHMPKYTSTVSCAKNTLIYIAFTCQGAPITDVRFYFWQSCPSTAAINAFFLAWCSNHHCYFSLMLFGAQITYVQHSHSAKKGWCRAATLAAPAYFVLSAIVHVLLLSTPSTFLTSQILG